MPASLATSLYEGIMSDLEGHSVQQQAIERIEAGEDPTRLCHVILLMDGTELLSDSLDQNFDVSDLLGDYRTLAEWAEL